MYKRAFHDSATMPAVKFFFPHPCRVDKNMHNTQLLLSMSKKRMIPSAVFLIASLVLSACQSGSSSPQNPPADQQTTMQDSIDYTGLWMTSCTSINPQQSHTLRLELNEGRYTQERRVFEGQSCGSEETSIFTLTDVGTYVVSGTVDVPSGVVAHDVRLSVESRIRDGEQVSISDDQGYSDFLHRNGNTLIRAKSNLIGVAAVQFSEELDFSIVYFLQENL